MKFTQKKLRGAPPPLSSDPGSTTDYPSRRRVVYNKPNGVQKMINHFIIVTSLAKSNYG